MNKIKTIFPWLLCLAILLAGLFAVVYVQQGCTTKVVQTSAVETCGTETEITTPVEEPLLVETYNDSLGDGITFDFPDTWNVYTKSNVDAYGLTTIELSPLTLGDCLECGGYYGNVAITISSIRYPLERDDRNFGGLTSAEQIVSKMEESEVTTIVSKTTKVLTEGTLTELVVTDKEGVICDSPGGCGNPSAELIFESNKNSKAKGRIVIVRMDNIADDVSAAWDLLKETIDF